MFQVRKDCWNVNYIQSYAICTKNICKACFPFTNTPSVNVRAPVPWGCVSCDNFQDGSVELLRVCKGLAVQKSLETVHIRWEEGGGGAEAPGGRMQGAAK